MNKDLLAGEKFAPESLRTFEDGEIIFAEGDDSREMYIVVEGGAVICKTSARGEICLAKVKRGEFLGEMSLLESLPRSATAKAFGHTKLLAIHPGGFLLKIRRDPTFAFELLQVLSKRIRKTNEDLMIELNRAGSSLESVKALLQNAEFNVPDTESNEPKK